MSDELPVEDGAQDTAAEPTNWEQRYKDTHANWNSLNERFQKFEKDPAAVLEFLQEKHPDLLVDDEKEETEDPFVDTDEDEEPMTRAEFKAWQAEQAQAAKATAAQNQFETDYKKFVGDRELDPEGDAFIRHTASRGEIKGPEDLRQTVDKWFAYIEGKAAPKAKPRAPHVPANGSAATDVPTYDGMSRAEVDRAMAERAMGHLSQS